MPSPPPFRYFLDPLSLAAALSYALNQIILKPTLGSAVPFVRNHLDDCLLIPAALPLLLWIFRKLKLRKHDLHPVLSEIVFYTVLWGLLFEGLFPLLFHKGIADPRDLLAYGTGALLSWGYWSDPRW